MTEREATLDELLNDPIIRKVMAIDGVRAADVRGLCFRTASERSERSTGQGAAASPQLSLRSAIQTTSEAAANLPDSSLSGAE